MKYKFPSSLVLCAMLIGACTSSPAATDDPGSVPSVEPATPESADNTAPTATAPAVTVDGDGQSFVEYASGPLWIHLFSPLDGAVVQSQQISITGQAPAGTVISLNDTIYIVPADQSIDIPIVLEEGPNALELVASDVDGNEVAIVLSITYEP